MNMRSVMKAVAIAVLFSPLAAFAGPYTEAGIESDDPSLIAWATDCVEYLPADNVDEQWQVSENALGATSGDETGIVALGECADMECEPGRITLTFADPIADGEGADFAVFENSFYVGTSGLLFAELGYVEVSTDGEVFARFPTVSLTESAVGAYGSLDPTDVYNLAGKHANAFDTFEGTPFDLAELADQPEVLSGEVDLDSIPYVRIVDVPGFGGYLDSFGNPIYDPHPTTGSGGFDLDAVGVIHEGDPRVDVRLRSFVALGAVGRIVVEWEAIAETGIVSYELLRSAEAGEAYAPLATIPAQGVDLLYEQEDADVTEGVTYNYRLLAVDLDGAEHEFGPVSAKALDEPIGVACGAHRADPSGLVVALAVLASLALARRWRHV